MILFQKRRSSRVPALSTTGLSSSFNFNFGHSTSLMKDAPGTRDYDWWLLAILAAICALGVVEIYSATHGSRLRHAHEASALAGYRFVLMFALSRLDYHLILDQAPLLYLVGLAASRRRSSVRHTHFGASAGSPSRFWVSLFRCQKWLN